MKKSFTAIALCLNELMTPAPAAAETADYPSRPATATEMKQCKNWSDFQVVSIDPNDSNPEFAVLSCAMAAVSQYDCARLFRVASVSNTVRELQGGTLNEKQQKLEERWYGQLGMVYEKNCNFGY